MSPGWGETKARHRPCTKHIQYVPYIPESGSHGRIIFADIPGFPDPDPMTQQEEKMRIENAKESRKWELRLIRLRPDSASLSRPKILIGHPGSNFLSR